MRLWLTDEESSTAKKRNPGFAGCGSRCYLKPDTDLAQHRWGKTSLESAGGKGYSPLQTALSLSLEVRLPLVVKKSYFEPWKDKTSHLMAQSDDLVGYLLTTLGVRSYQSLLQGGADETHFQHLDVLGDIPFPRHS